MPQLQINQGPQDALLYDNTRSFFTSVGYTRSSNFQVEYRDVDPQNTAQLGSTVQFVIPKAADLLGQVDLRVTIDPPPDAAACISGGADNDGERSFAQWVDELGYAMIEKCTFSVGSNDIETITGEQMQLKNELMTSDECRLGFHHVMKTGRRAFSNVARHPKATGMVNVTSGTDSTTCDVDHVNGLIEPGDAVFNADRKCIGIVQKFVGDSTAGTTGSKGEITWTRATLVSFTNDTAFTVHSVVKQNERPGDNSVTDTTNEEFLKKTNEDYTRLVCYGDSFDPKSSGFSAAHNTFSMQVPGQRELIIPLNLFFTKHVSSYFPLAAVAGCNDIRIAIKFRSFNELCQFHSLGCDRKVQPAAIYGSRNPLASGKTQLRCHYVHVTGPEASTLMNKEHVRLLKLWQHQTQTFQSVKSSIDIDLSFLHPVTTLIITIRRVKDMSSTTDVTQCDAGQKGYFFYHGDGTNPNFDRARDGKTGLIVQGAANSSSTHTVQLKSMQLMLNGQERHPGLANGIDVKYLQHRLLPQLHSNSNAIDKQIAAQTQVMGNGHDANVSSVVSEEDVREQLKGSKNIFVYPFSLNPEGGNPAGAVNFSKVSHAKLRLFFNDQVTLSTSPLTSTPSEVTKKGGECDYRVDVYGLYYNWLQIKDGRALLSFA